MFILQFKKQTLPCGPRDLASLGTKRKEMPLGKKNADYRIPAHKEIHFNPLFKFELEAFGPSVTVGGGGCCRLAGTCGHHSPCRCVYLFVVLVLQEVGWQGKETFLPLRQVLPPTPLSIWAF